MIGERGGNRPLRIDLAQVQVGAGRQSKTHSLQRYERERTPPDRATRAKAGSRQSRDVLNEPLLHRSSSGISSGQNQPIRVIVTGTEPHTIAHGVKIEPRKVPPTAMAASKGQIVGTGELSRSCGRASVNVPVITWRESTSSPVTTGRLSRLSQSGSRCVTKGIRLKLYAAGGESVPHSSVPASHGLAEATSPEAALMNAFTKSNAKLMKRMSAPAVDSRFKD